jgi:hypothetical protein
LSDASRPVKSGSIEAVLWTCLDILVGQLRRLTS